MCPTCSAQSSVYRFQNWPCNSRRPWERNSKRRHFHKIKGHPFPIRIENTYDRWDNGGRLWQLLDYTERIVIKQFVGQPFRLDIAVLPFVFHRKYAQKRSRTVA